MYCLLDMRSLVENRPESGDFFTVDFLHALFRNHPSDTFFLWTTGEYDLPKEYIFDEYHNTRTIHTDISSKDLEWYTDWFSAIFVDDMVETECMKKGMMPWVGKFDVLLTCSPRPLLCEENCLLVHILNHLNPLRFPENISHPNKYYSIKRYKKTFDSAGLIITPSLFLAQECQYFCAVPSEKILSLSAAIAQELLPPQEIDPLWNSLPEYYFFVHVIDEIGMQIAIKAFELWKSKNPEANWEMIIEEPQKGVLWQWYEKRKHVHILSPLSEDHHMQVLSRAAVYIELASYDPVGISLLTAMRFELPCISSSYGSFIEIGDTESMMFFDPTSAVELYEKMNILSLNEPLRSEYAQKAAMRSRLLQWNWDEIATQCMKKIEEYNESK